MKLTDKIVSRYGQDKVLHFLVGAWIVAQFDDYGLFWGILALLVVSGLGYAKERWLDKSADWEDVKFAAIGGIVELAFYTIRTIVF